MSGDRKAFAAIVSEHQASVLALCRRYVPTEASDLGQETFVRAFVHRESFDPTRPLRPWLLTIARRLCLDHLRRRRDALPYHDEAEPHPSVPRTPPPTPELALDRRQQLARLDIALSLLPAGQREVLALYHLDGLSYAEIASTLEVPMGTVMTWLHRGRARLRAELGDAAGHGASS